MYIRNKCNTLRMKLSNIYTIRFSDVQLNSLRKLVEYNVNISEFIRQAIKEKIQRDWKSIKEQKEKFKQPF